MNNIQDILLNAAANVLGQIANFLPRIFGALIIFFVGIILSNWARSLTVKFIKTINILKFLKGTGVATFLKKAKIPYGIEELIGQIIRWVVILVFFIATMNLLGLNAVSEVLGKILAYVPNVLSATFILAIGILIAGVLESVVKGAVGSLNGKSSRLLGKITSYTVVTFAALAAIGELQIAEGFVQTIFTGFIATLALGLGLAIGLGSKDTVAKIVGKWYEKANK